MSIPVSPVSLSPRNFISDPFPGPDPSPQSGGKTGVEMMVGSETPAGYMEGHEGYSDGLHFMSAVSCLVTLAVGLFCVVTSFGGRGRDTEPNDAVLKPFKTVFLSYSWQLHKGLLLVGLMLVVQAGLAFQSVKRCSVPLASKTRMLYAATLATTLMLLLLTSLQASKAPTSMIETLHRKWLPLKSQGSDVCIVENYFKCSGFWHACEKKPAINQVLHIHHRATAGFGAEDNHVIPAPLWATGEETECNYTCNHTAIDGSSSLLGFRFTPPEYLEESYLNTPCATRFLDMVGLSRSMTASICIAVIFHSLFNLYLFQLMIKSMEDTQSSAYVE